MAANGGKVVTSQQQVTEDPLNVFRFENEWNAPIFACLEDIKFALCSYFCWVVALCSVSKNMKESCWVHICVPVPLIFIRTKMRSILRIRGSMWRDTLMTLFLPFCTLIQMKAELKQRGLAESKNLTVSILINLTSIIYLRFMYHIDRQF